MKDESAAFSSKCMIPFTFLILGLFLLQGPLTAAHGKGPAGENPLLSTTGQPPPVQDLALDPSSPVTGDRLRAIAPVDDQDPSQPKLFYRWKVNGQVVQESWETVLESPFKCGDLVELEVTASEGSSSGSTLKRSTVVGNAPPTLKLSEQNMDNDGRYQARLEARDPEGEPVTFSLKSGPSGMTVDPSSGTISWSLQPGSDADCGVQVSATDDKGAETILNYQIKASWQKSEGVEKHAATKASTK